MSEMLAVLGLGAVVAAFLEILIDINGTPWLLLEGYLVIALIAFVIFLIVKVIRFVVEKVSDFKIRHNRFVNPKKYQEEEAQRQRECEENKRRQAQTVLDYQNSPLLREIIQTFCYEDGVLIYPTEFTISDDRIQCIRNGVPMSFDFTEHRVAKLQHAHGIDDDRESIFRPQVAMAEAINHILNDEYNIVDRADISSTDYGDGDITYFYSANYVSMKLKPQRAF